MAGHYEAAKRILDRRRAAYQRRDTFVLVREDDFSHLDLGAYRRFKRELEAVGFKYLADMEILEVSNAPDSLLARTMIRVQVSSDGVVADYYQTKPRIRRRLKGLLKGLRNRRWIDAPRGFIKAMATKHCVGFETEFSDGSFITTSNAEKAAAISSPPTIDAEFHPYGTPHRQLLESHHRRVQAKLDANPNLTTIKVGTIDDSLQMGRRMKELKNAHRANVGWVTKEELIKLSNNNPALATSIYNEIQKILLLEKQAEASKLSPQADVFLAQAMAEFPAKQNALKDAWRFDAFEEWSYDTESGMLTLQFSDRGTLQADGQLLGTYCVSDSSFEWAWNNPHFDGEITRDSKLAQAVGQELNISYLKAGMIPIPHTTLLSYICAIGVKAAQSQGMFRGHEGDVHPIILVKNLRWAQ